jgi:hypothetical protein
VVNARDYREASYQGQTTGRCSKFLEEPAAVINAVELSSYQDTCQLKCVNQKGAHRGLVPGTWVAHFIIAEAVGALQPFQLGLDGLDVFSD